MLKTIGMILLTLGLCGAGFAYTACRQNQLRSAQNALEAVRLLKGQVEFLHLPLREAIASLKSRNLLLMGPYPNGTPLGEGRLEQTLKELRLGRADRESLLTLFKAVPMLPAGETAPFDQAIRELEESVALQKAALQQNGTLYPKLGLLAGMTILLLMI